MLKEARELQKAMVAIIRSWRPDLLEEFGVGPIVAATVLCAWSHPGRIHSEAAFAMLAGVAPIPANSGQRELAAAATSSPGISAVPRRNQCSGANRAVKCRRCLGWDTMRIPGRSAARPATRVRTSMT